MASSPIKKVAVTASEQSTVPVQPATSVINKTIVFSPIDIKKIGLDKLIKAKVAPATSTAADNTDKTMASPSNTKSEQDEIRNEPVSTKIQNLFCKNLKLKMQKVLQDKKITIVAKKKEQELVITKKPSESDGKKIKVVQSQIIHLARKPTDGDASINGQTTVITVNTAPAIKPVPKKSASFDFDEGPSPVFKVSPMRTYKRKRSEGEEILAKKVTANFTPFKEREIHECVKIPAEIPKKRGRKSKIVEIYSSEDSDEEDSVEIELAKEQEDEDIDHDDDSDAEEIIIVQVPEKDKDDLGDEEIHFITDKDEDDEENDEEEVEEKEDAPRAGAKRPGRRSMAEIIQAIKKKRGRKSKSELELLAKWDKETKAKEKKADDEDDDEEKSDEDEDEEVEKIIMSPTRTGRVPKRNKLFDNFVTGSRATRKRSSSDADEPKEKVPPKVDSTANPAPKRRGRPPKNKPVETPKIVEEDEKVKKGVESKGEAVHVTGDDEVIVIPKKRGRPPVQKVHVQKVQVQIIEREKALDDGKRIIKIDNKLVVVKRLPGRPPKIPRKVVEKKEETPEEKVDDHCGKSDSEVETKDDATGDKSSDETAAKETKELRSVEDTVEEEELQTETCTEMKNGTNSEGKTEDAEDPVPKVDAENAAAVPAEETSEVVDEKEEDGAEEQPEVEKESEEAEVIAVCRRGGSPKKPAADEPKVKGGLKHKLELVESPSTSAADGVDEPSKKQKLDTSNEPVADLGATPVEEGANKKMYRLLVTNLVVNVRERMTAAQDQPKGPGQTVTCAICKIHCKPNAWKAHKLRWHNNLAWKTTEEPLDLDNQKLVQSTLMIQYPAKPYYCDVCADSKRSVLGFLAHKLQCNRSPESLDEMRVACDLCSKRILPHQIVEHSKAHQKHGLEITRDVVAANQNIEEIKCAATGSTITVSTDTGEEPIKDMNITGTGESSYTAMYRLLTANLAENIRERMAAAEEKPKEPDQSVTCGVCKIHCKPSDWTDHKLRWHNNVTWKEGQEDPLDLDNQHDILSALQIQYPKKPYICDFCEDRKKSAFAFLTHKTQCCTTPERMEAIRITCVLCKKVIMAQQIVDHEMYHRKQAESAQKAQRRSQLAAKDNTGDDGNSTPRRRNAAQRASLIIQETTEYLSIEDIQFVSLKRLKQLCTINNFDNVAVKSMLNKRIEAEGEIECTFGCKAKFADITSICKHYNTCRDRPDKFFICIICAAKFEVISAIRKHVVNLHPEEVQSVIDGDNFVADVSEEDDVDDDYGDVDDLSRSQVHNGFWKLLKFAKLNVKTPTRTLSPAGVNSYYFTKMFEFCKLHFSSELYTVYPFKKSSWFGVNKNYICEYLPVMKQSIPIAQQTGKTPPTAESFKRYKLFETSVDNGVVNIYCGGPITALCWAPTVFEQADCEQILAVAIRQDPDKKYNTKKNWVHRGLIQLWNFGVMDNAQAVTSAPELEVAIAHQYGEVLAMEWCPSGCYELHGARLGLLAICTTDGNVHCYSVGRSGILSEKLCKPKPVFRLAVSTECSINIGMKQFYPTQISWSKAAGHKYIAVGYSNGIVGMFNIQTQNPLLGKVVETNINVFFPYLSFKADNREITALNLKHLDGGNRFLVTASGTRLLKFWDLGVSPLRSTVLSKRSCCHQIFSPVNSTSIITSTDDSSSNAYLSLAVTHLTNFDYARSTTLITSHAAGRTVGGTHWANLIYLANEAGEVAYATYRDMYAFVSEMPCKAYVCSNLNVIGEENVQLSLKERQNFKIVQKSHKVVFHDYRMDFKKFLKKQDRTMHSMSCPDFARYPLEAATVTCANNNRFSFLFNAVGYNIGFVRVFHANFLNAPY